MYYATFKKPFEKCFLLGIKYIKSKMAYQKVIVFAEPNFVLTSLEYADEPGTELTFMYVEK